ncbi:glycosyltransferase [Streptomyces netropsis]|uniref:glycosyltransferase n=1 Tax=Streptomyces netropsis TaxID=55404 RepID=UPI0037A406B5
MGNPPHAISVLLNVIDFIALLMSVGFLTYVALIVIPYVRRTPQGLGCASNFDWHLLVPCRDEETVIGNTIAQLRARFPGAHLWAIDDASVDGTAREIQSQMTPESLVHLVSRRLPEAREGKGAALNAAYNALDRWLPTDTDRSRVIVGVIDADGVPAANCLDICSDKHLLGDTEVSSVQVGVRMLNRHESRPFPNRGRLVNNLGRTLIRMQDLEFSAPIAAIQLTRRFTRTVALGGNGQFTRIRALDAVRERYGKPWGDALLEDYQLSLHLLLTGHRIEYTPDTHVAQEGLPNLRRLLAQRTRWGQGNMQCSRYISDLWACENLPKKGKVEVTYYLLAPWLQLVGTFVYLIPFLLSCMFAMQMASSQALPAWGGIPSTLLHVLIGIGPFALWGPLYARHHEPAITFRGSIGCGAIYSVYVLMLFYITSWRAFFRIIRRRNTWAKTRRNGETNRGPVAIER